MDIYFDIFDTPFGWMGVLASEKGLRSTTLPQNSPDECFEELGPEMDGAIQDEDRFSELRHRIIRYFEGDAISFEDVPVDLEGASEFYRAAWKACQSIPHGETRTYGWLAGEAGKPRAPRAAGQSMARNRLPIIVPCHRVIGADGSLRGFGKGTTQLGLKKRLLGNEGR
jgi:methylated-DNA-[protein]-cysteine S-methyltransferase